MRQKCPGKVVLSILEHTGILFISDCTNLVTADTFLGRSVLDQSSRTWRNSSVYGGGHSFLRPRHTSARHISGDTNLSQMSMLSMPGSSFMVSGSSFMAPGASNVVGASRISCATVPFLKLSMWMSSVFYYYNYLFLKCYKRLSASLQLYNIHNTKYMFIVI